MKTLLGIFTLLTICSTIGLAEEKEFSVSANFAGRYYLDNKSFSILKSGESDVCHLGRDGRTQTWPAVFKVYEHRLALVNLDRDGMLIDVSTLTPTDTGAELEKEGSFYIFPFIISNFFHEKLSLSAHGDTDHPPSRWFSGEEIDAETAKAVISASSCGIFDPFDVH